MSEGSLALALATMIRVLAIALPAVVLFVTVDPTDLADGLAQVLKLPARFVLGALAALRLVGSSIDDWRALELARRARGVADRGVSGASSAWRSRCSCCRSAAGQARDRDGGARVRCARSAHLGAPGARSAHPSGE